MDPLTLLLSLLLPRSKPCEVSNNRFKSSTTQDHVVAAIAHNAATIKVSGVAPAKSEPLHSLPVEPVWSRILSSAAKTGNLVGKDREETKAHLQKIHGIQDADEEYNNLVIASDAAVRIQSLQELQEDSRCERRSLLAI